MKRSRVKELADEEAARAEAESPDDEEEEGTDENPEPESEDEAEEEAESEPEAAAEPLSMEARVEAIETLTKVHFDSLEIIFGDEWASANNCPLCGGLGAVFPDDPKLDETLERCPTCRGHGVRFTPSQVPEHMTETCLDCNGNGWRVRVTAPPPEAAPVAAPIPPMPVYDPTSNSWITPQSNGPTGYPAPAYGPGAVS